MANPNTASPTLKVIKINIIVDTPLRLIKILLIKSLVKESISKIKSIEIKLFLFFLYPIVKTVIQDHNKVSIKKHWKTLNTINAAIAQDMIKL